MRSRYIRDWLGIVAFPYVALFLSHFIHLCGKDPYHNIFGINQFVLLVYLTPILYTTFAVILLRLSALSERIYHSRLLIPVLVIESVIFVVLIYKHGFFFPFLNTSSRQMASLLLGFCIFQIWRTWRKQHHS